MPPSHHGEMMSHSSQLGISGGTFAVGKFAGHPEFLRPDDGGDAIESLDGWIDEGNQDAHERWGAQWGRDFPMGAAYGFLWRARTEAAHLCGVIAPSRDAVGRDYPLAIAARFPSELLARAPHVVPLAFGDFLDAAYALVDEGRSHPMSLADFLARLQEIGASTAQEVADAAAEYDAWSLGTPLEEAWGAIFPGEGPIEQAFRALEAIGATLAPLRGREDPNSRLVLRLPLGNGGVAAAALWMDVVRRICRWSSTIPSGFWAVDSGVLLLPVGDVPARTYSELWHPGPGEFVCEGEDSKPWSLRAGAQINPAQILRDTGAGSPMAAFLDGLGR